jgi:alanyl-tRNA synthetase
MNSNEIREKFLAFFKEKNHVVLDSASLIPDNDSSVLFNTAGMQPLVPYLLGQKHPLGNRLVNIQKCVRTVDLDEIGDNTHATFFEMMGNWSLGDYFKDEAINWSYQLLTDKKDGFGLDPNRLYVTCFAGDENAPRDEQTAQIWQKIFDKNNIDGNRIFFLPAENNWWSPGDNGPCGPDTEMFYDVTGQLNSGLSHEEFLLADQEQKIVEIWNDVFMEYQKQNGKVIGKLSQKNVDTGSGLERMVMILQNKDNIYDTDIFQKIIGTVRYFSKQTNQRAERIISDHLRTSVMLISDGVKPSNSDQGYVLRRLIRRAVIQSDALEMPNKSLSKIAESVIETYQNIYPKVKKLSKEILIEIDNEENKFRKTLEDGLKHFRKIIKKQEQISGQDAFLLFSSYGFPIELIAELAKEQSLTIDLETFNQEFQKHQNLSRAKSEHKFKGGLSDNSYISLKYHTATHLLHQALRQVLGNHISQKGSNITSERLRFDFSHSEKMTEEQKEEVEKLVNQKINESLPVNHITMSKIDAEKTGALHFFGEKYPEEVMIYYIGNSLENAYSKEFCGGPHVTNTSSLGKFKIKKEEAVSSGVRRIKAVLE